MASDIKIEGVGCEDSTDAPHMHSNPPHSSTPELSRIFFVQALYYDFLAFGPL